MALPRILTAIVLVPLVVAAIWYGSVPFFLFVLGVAILSFWEYAVMAGGGGYPNRLILGLLGTAALILALSLDGARAFGPVHEAPSPLFMLVLWLIVAFSRELFATDKTYAFLRVITTTTGVLLCGFAIGHLLLIRDLKLVAGEGFTQVGRQVTFFLFIVIWSVDTGAWLVGKTLGRFPLAPRLSPKKTIEGTVGGTLIACAVGWFLREALLRDAMGSVEAVIFALIIAVVAQMSDLTESMLKRTFNAKNSSELLPGHGGLLDRFDSFIFAAPLFYYLLLATGRFE